MYKLIIKTKYNVINLVVEDVNSPEVKEILEQPYIIEFYMEKLNTPGGIEEKYTPSYKKLLIKGDKNGR